MSRIESSAPVPNAGTISNTPPTRSSTIETQVAAVVSAIDQARNYDLAQRYKQVHAELLSGDYPLLPPDRRTLLHDNVNTIATPILLRNAEAELVVRQNTIESLQAQLARTPQSHSSVSRKADDIHRAWRGARDQQYLERIEGLTHRNAQLLSSQKQLIEDNSLALQERDARHASEKSALELEQQDLCALISRLDAAQHRTSQGNGASENAGVYVDIEEYELIVAPPPVEAGDLIEVPPPAVLQESPPLVRAQCIAPHLRHVEGRPTEAQSSKQPRGKTRWRPLDMTPEYGHPGPDNRW